MFTALLVLLFGQNLSDINYKFMKKDSVIFVEKSKDDNKRYEFTLSFQFISNDHIKHPYLPKNTINLSKQKTKNYNNMEIFSDSDFRSIFYPDTKKYVYLTFSFGYIKTDGKASQEELKEIILRHVSSSIADLNISFNNVKIDVIIPEGKSYFDGKIEDGAGLGGRKLP